MMAPMIKPPLLLLLSALSALSATAWASSSSSSSSTSKYRVATVTKKSSWLSEKFLIHDGVVPGWIALANFTDSINATGWSQLEVTTNGSFSDSEQAYAAGLAEARVTSDLIELAWLNTVDGYCDPKNLSVYCRKLKKHLDKNIHWMIDTLEKSDGRGGRYGGGGDDPYWHQVRLILNQLAGLEDGIDDGSSRERPRVWVTSLGFLLFQINGDLEDLESVYQRDASSEKGLSRRRPNHVLGSGSCSALVKVLANNSDLLFSHDTWSVYNTMLRINKRYDFRFRMSAAEGAAPIPGRTVSFSSYPGSIFSGDDFYISSAGLAIMETTIGNSNASLWKDVKPVGQVLEWMRNIIANRLASTGKEWTEIFRRYNSGTYNNQWMIADYKLFKPGKPLPDADLLWVLEQIPGYIRAEDQTGLLKRRGYWPSYNIPFYADVFNMSGSLPNVAKFGDWFTYDKNPRAKIFARDHVHVKDMTSMKKMMRYNNYINDPASACPKCSPIHASAENSIMARSDLNPMDGTYPFGALGARCHGGTDTKITDSSLVLGLSFVAQSGPTADDQPVFKWSDSKANACSDETLYKHHGHPDAWNFPAVLVQWSKIKT